MLKCWNEGNVALGLRSIVKPRRITHDPMPYKELQVYIVKTATTGCRNPAQ